MTSEINEQERWQGSETDYEQLSPHSFSSDSPPTGHLISYPYIVLIEI